MTFVCNSSISKNDINIKTEHQCTTSSIAAAIAAALATTTLIS
jgi:hypothetical protein